MLPLPGHLPDFHRLSPHTPPVAVASPHVARSMLASSRTRVTDAHEGDLSAFVPDWVPELTPGTHADVYPVDGRPNLPSAELRLDRQAVTGGYAERRKAFEFHTCISGSPEAPPRSNAVPLAVPASTLAETSDGAALARMIGKIRVGLAGLRRSRPAKVQRLELGRVPRPADPATTANTSRGVAANAEDDKKRALFPYQKPSRSLDDWFNRLSAGGSFSTANLCGAVPLGPAIVRAAGKVLEMMAVRDVPTQRAAWYIRIAVLNECVKQVRLDRPPQSPRVFWTRQLCNLLKTELDAIRARKNSSLGNMDRLSFWQYVLDLARWQADEGLLDDAAWLKRLVTSLRAEVSAAPTLHTMGAKICVCAVQRFLPQFHFDRTMLTLMREALRPAAAQTLGAACAALHGGGTPGKRGQSRSTQSQSMEYTPSQPAFNNAVLRLANLFGSSGSEQAAVQLLMATRPEKFTADAAVEKALELVSAKDYFDGTSSAKTGKVANNVADLKSHLDLTASLEKFPVTGNPERLRRTMKSAFQNSGGDRACVEHVCKWAIAAKSLRLTHVVATAAAAIEILVDGASKKHENPSIAKLEPGSIESETSPSRPTNAQSVPPMFHREIWLFLKELGEEESETCVSDERVVALIARFCRVGLFSLPIFVRDVARVASLSQGGTMRLIRYVQMLPESHERHAADIRRSLLRRNGLLPSEDEQTQIASIVERSIKAIRSGDELIAIGEGALVKQNGETRIQLAVVDAVVQEVTEAQEKALEKASVIFRTTVSFLRAAGAAPLAADFTLSRLNRLMAATTENSGVRQAQGIYAGVGVGVDCLPHLAPVLAATNQISAAIVVLGRVWNMAVDVPQSRIRQSVERAGVMIGKYFCSSAADEHDSWKQLVLRALPLSNMGTMKQLFCGLLGGVPPSFFEKHYSTQPPHRFLMCTSHMIRGGRGSVNNKTWMMAGIDNVMASKKSTLRKALIENMELATIERFFKELMCVSHVTDGVIIPVLRVSEKLNTVKVQEREAYRKAVKNITSILCSTWMEALGDEMRLHSAVEIVALLLVGAHCNYQGAHKALMRICMQPWIRRLIALHAGKRFYKHMRNVVKEYTPKDLYDEGTMVRKIGTIIALLCDKPREDEESDIISGIGVEPAGATQMQMCSALSSRRVQRNEHQFARHTADVVVTCVSHAETCVLTRMLLECYDDPKEKAVAAGEIALRASDAMAESLKFFTTGITVTTHEHNLLNQQRAKAWFGADEARRAMVCVCAPHLDDVYAKQLARALVSQIGTLAQRLLNARAKKLVPRDGSPTGVSTSAAILSRARVLHALSRAADPAAAARAAARLLSAAAFVLRPDAADALITLLNTFALAVGETVRVELRTITQESRTCLERAHCRALDRALGGSSSRVVARRANGEVIDNWYLIEGYGRGEDEEAAVAPTTFSMQGASNERTASQSVRLKRTYSTFSCLVR